jgi:hypothetical protein
VLLDAGALIVIAPQFRRVTRPVGNKDTEGISLHLDETPPHRALVFTDPLTNGEELTRLGPTVEFERKAGHE